MIKRFNAIQDEENDLEAKRLQKVLDKHDAKCSYDGSKLKINFLGPIQKNSATNQRSIHLPKRLLKEAWAYYKLSDFKMPYRLRIYLMFDIDKKGEENE